MSDNATTDKNESRARRAGRAAGSGLDVMLGEAASGGPPRFIAPGSAVRGRGGPGSPPGTGHRPRRRPRRRAGPHRRRTLGRPAGEGRSAVRRSRVGGQLAAPAGAPGLPRGRRDRRRADHRRRNRLAGRATREAGGSQRARRARPDELRLVQPDRDQGDRRHRWRATSFAARAGSCMISTRRPICRRRWIRASSRSGATSRRRPGRSCSAPKCSS